MVETVNRIAGLFNPAGQVDLTELIAARARAGATGKVNAESATPIIEQLHQSISSHLPAVSPEVFVKEFQAALKASPASNFDGKGKYDPREQALLAKFSSIVDAQKVSIDLNLSDDPRAPEVLQKAQDGLGAIPPEYKSVLTNALLQVIKDDPTKRKSFEDLIRFAKASLAILDEAKKANLSAEDTVKLTNLLQQAQPLEGVSGVLIAKAVEAAAKLDVEALVNIFKDYAKSLDGIVKPLVENHMPKDLDQDPLKVAQQVQAPFENILTGYVTQAAPVAQDVIRKVFAYLEKNAGTISQVAANAFAGFSAFANDILKVFLPSPTKLTDILGISPKKAAKFSSN